MKWRKAENPLIHRQGSGPEHQNAYHRLTGLIFLVSAIFVFLCIQNGHDWGSDFALYIRQAKSLTEGNMLECLTTNAWSMANSDYKISPDLYPWGFPLLLAPVYYFFGMDLLSMKLLGIVFFYLCLIIISLLLRNKLDRASRLLVLGVFAINPFLIKFTDNILSDFPGLFFCLFSIFLIERTFIEKKRFMNKAASLVLLGFSIWLAQYMRPNYILLLPTLFMAQVIEMRASKQDFRDYIVANKSAVLPYAVFVILTVISEKTLPKGGSYGFYAEFISNMNIEYLTGNIYYTAMLPADFFEGGHTVRRGLYFLTLPFVVKGIRLTWKKDYVYIVFFALTAAFFALWPGRQGLRYIFSLLPFYIYFLMIGLNSFRLATKTREFNPSRIFFCLLLAFFFAQTSFAAYKNMKDGRKTAEGPFTHESSVMFRYITENTDKKDVMVFFKPRALTLLADRRAFLARELSSMESKGDYLIINKKTKSDQVSIESNEFAQKISSDYFARVFENGGFIIYRINRACFASQKKGGGGAHPTISKNLLTI